MSAPSSGPNQKTGGKSILLMQQRLLANASNNNSSNSSSNCAPGTTNVPNNGQESSSNVSSSNNVIEIDNNVTQNQSGQGNTSTLEGSQSNSNKSGNNDSSISIVTARPTGKSAAHLMRAQERMKKQSPVLNPEGSPLGNPPPIHGTTTAGPVSSSNNNNENSNSVKIVPNMKPKGKDFIAMAARSQQASTALANSKSDKGVSNESVSSTGHKPHIPSLPPMDTNINPGHETAVTTAGGPPGNNSKNTTGNTTVNNPYPVAPTIPGRSTGKGKDFAAMLSRSTTNSTSKLPSNASGASPGLHPMNPNPSLNNSNMVMNNINTTNKNMNASRIPPQNTQAPSIHPNRLAPTNAPHQNTQNTMNNLNTSSAPSASQQQQNMYSNPPQPYNHSVNLSVPPTSNKATTLTKPVNSNTNMNMNMSMNMNMNMSMNNVNSNPYMNAPTSSTPTPKPGGKAAQLAALAAQSKSTLSQNTLDRKPSQGNRADVSQQQQHQSTFPMQQQPLLQNINTNNNMTNNNTNINRTNPNMPSSPHISMPRNPSVPTANFPPSFNSNQNNPAMPMAPTNNQNKKSTMSNSQEVTLAAPPPKPAPKPTKMQGRLSNNKSSTKINNGSTKKSMLHPHSTSTTPTITGIKLQSLLSSISPNYILDDEAQDQILHLADDFLDKLVSQSMKFAKHRDSKNVNVKDVKLALKKKWGMNIEGFGLGGSKSHDQANTNGGRTTAKSKANNDSDVGDGTVGMKERGLKRNIIDISGSSTN